MVRIALKLTTLPEAATYQTQSINIGVITHVIGEVPIGHPRIYEGERRIGVEPKEADHI